MRRAIHKALIIILCCWLSSCVKDKPSDTGTKASGGIGDVFVVCEGNFGTGDASLYVYLPLKDSVYGDLYKAANNQSLGDVFQSMVRIDDRYFLCVNNSDKVVVINATTKKLEGVISIAKPRYILQVSGNKAYVSTLYSNKVYIINTQSLTVTGTIEVPSLNPEGMCLYYNTAFICTWDTASNNIIKIDAATDKVVQTVKIGGYAAQSALIDKEQMLWVLSGNKQQGRSDALTRIDPSTGTILKSYIFSADADALKPVFNATKDTLYFIEVNYNGGSTDNGIYRMGIHDAALPAQPFVAALQYQYFWALGIDPATGYIYVGDPKGFVQKGSVSVYKPNGTEVLNFNVGLGPGAFYFDK